jgi:hypothetical protein
VTVAAGGVLAPGTPAVPAGTLTVIGKFDLSGGGTLAIDLANGTVGDRVAVSGNANLTGAMLVVNAVGGYAPRGGDGPWTILTTTGTVSGAFATLPAGYIVNVGSQSVTLSRAISGTTVFFR